MIMTRQQKSPLYSNSVLTTDSPVNKSSLKMLASISLSLLLSTSCAFSAVYTVNSSDDTTNVTAPTDTPTTLRDAILLGNASSDANITINLTGTGIINLTAALPMISNYSSASPAGAASKTWTITGPGGGITIDGQSLHRGLFLSPVPENSTDTDIPQAYPHTLTVNLANITLKNTKAKGGDGSGGSGGGGGGIGGNSINGGGGGIGGNSINGGGNNSSGSGIGNSGDFITGGSWAPGYGGSVGQILLTGMINFDTGGSGSGGGNSGGIGGGGGSGGGSGGFGAGGGVSIINGGNGGFGGGGGGSVSATGGNGGFGGGGGIGGVGGNGGFGGGGPGSGGFGGGGNGIGGGAGMGGALFINKNTIVNLDNILFSSNNATGGTDGGAGFGGAIFLRQGGTLTINGLSSESGGTTNAGSVSATAAGNSLFIVGQSASPTNVTFDTSAGNIIIASSISDDAGNTKPDDGIAGTSKGGSITKQGAGILTLSGINTYSGATTVSTGALKVNGSISNSATTVSSGATISGTGTVGPLTINGGGIIAPGNSIGILNIAGAYIQNGTYTCEVQAAAVPVAGTDNDQISVTGAATLGGTLNVIPTGNYTTGQIYTYTILTATGGLGGTQFATVSGTSTLFSYAARYVGNNVFLDLVKINTLGQIGTSGNPGSIASYIDTNASASLIDQLNPLTQDQLELALSQLSPAQRTQVTDMLTNETLTGMETPFTNVAMDRLVKKLDHASSKLVSALASFKQNFTQVFTSKLSHKATSFVISQSSDTKTLPVSARVNLGKATFWLEGGTGHSSQDTISDPSGLGVQGLTSRNYDTSIGLDYAITDSVKVGLTTGYGYSNYKMKLNGSKGTTNSGRLGVYGLWQVNPDWYVNGAAYYAHHRFRGDRIMTVLPAVAHQKHSGNHISGLVEVGRDIALPQAMTLTPYMSGGAVYFNEGRYTETGAGVQNLKVNSRHATTLQGKTGAQLAHLWDWDKSTPVYSFGRLGVTYRRALDSYQNVTASLAGQGGGFSVRTKNKNRVMANPSIGVTASLQKDIYATIAYEGELGTTSRNHQAMIRVNWKF